MLKNKDHQLPFQTFFKVNLVINIDGFSPDTVFSFISRPSNIQLHVLSQYKWSLALKHCILKLILQSAKDTSPKKPLENGTNLWKNST